MLEESERQYGHGYYIVQRGNGAGIGTGDIYGESFGYGCGLIGDGSGRGWSFGQGCGSGYRCGYGVSFAWSSFNA